MKLIYHPYELLDKKVNEVDLLNPGFGPKELKKQMVDLTPVLVYRLNPFNFYFILGASEGDFSWCLWPS